MNNVLLFLCILLFIQQSSTQTTTSRQHFNTPATVTAQCDLNGDGLNDIVAGGMGGFYSYLQSNVYGIPVSFGAGTYSNLTNSTTSGNITALVCKDTDGDGYAEVFACITWMNV